ncbi:MAG: hypothetical protein HUJ99_05490 [Bacteroidaceae bacterium]|nr:hypothetical protein [Bacteroidaceae bacterium]
MSNRFGFSIVCLWAFAVWAACTAQVENQENSEDVSGSASKAEICILPQHAYNTTTADFDMHHFSVGNDADSLIPALKKEGEDRNAVFSAVLPPVPVWMDDAQATDPLYRSAYRKYVKLFLDEYARLGVPIQTLYIQKNSRESRFATVEELSTVVKCQFRLVDELKGAASAHQPWMRVEKN